MSHREDPCWPRASQWLASGRKGSEITVLGVPLNRSVTPGRYDLGPQAIRDALRRFSTWPGQAGNLAECWDAGDAVLADSGPDGELLAVEESVAALAKAGRIVLLGGDNGLTRGAVRGLALAHNVELAAVGLLTLDAHFDLRTLDTGPMNGNPIRGLLADGMPGRNIVQIGIQPFANSPAYAHVAADAGIRCVMREGIASLADQAQSEVESLAERFEVIYVDVDLDVMDRAYAPGCPGSRPGGVTPLELLQAVRCLSRHPKVGAFDIVELDPSKDVNDATALAGARCLLEIAAGTSNP